MSAPRRDARSGASLVEVLVATLLVAVGVLIWWRSFEVSARRLDEAHLGLHAAILATEAARPAPGPPAPRNVGPGLMRAVVDSASIVVRYSPSDDGAGSGSGVYGRAFEWDFSR